MRALVLVCCALVGSGRADAAPPQGLTGWRVEKGIFLSWSDASKSFTLWRGTEPGKLSVMLTVPSGQSGFLDLSAGRASRYLYALGDQRSFGDVLEIPGASSSSRVLPGLVTTCSGLARGRWAPADTQNGFVASRNAHVQFFGAYFVSPFDASPHDTRVIWRDPAGTVIADLSGPVVAKRIELPGAPAGRLLLSLAIGLREALPQSGQRRVPTDPGQYTVEAFIDGLPVSLTTWYLGSESSGTPGAAGGVPGTPGSPSPSSVPPRLPLPALAEP